MGFIVVRLAIEALGCPVVKKNNAEAHVSMMIFRVRKYVPYHVGIYRCFVLTT